MKKILMIIFIGVLLFLVILTTGYAIQPENPGKTKACYFVTCENGSSFKHCGNINALDNRIRVICGE